MSRLLDDDQDLLQLRDRELTLSTGAILAIFLGLVILCALFFGFGYNLGRKSTAPVPLAPAVSSTDTGSSSPDSTFNDFKPSPSSPAAAPHESSSLPAVTLPVAPSSAPAPSTTTAAPVLRPASTTPHESPLAPHPVAPHPSAPVPPPAHTVASLAPAAPAIAPTGAFVVQIAAISRKDDADLLIGALRTKGYSAVERSEPQDKLIHIQVGPFATRKDAEAMRERLVIDGYNAIVK